MSPKKPQDEDVLFELPREMADHVEAVRAQNEERKQINKVLGPGPVYQGVGKTIRRLTAEGTYKDERQVLDPIEYAGTIAAARALARAIDKSTGHNPTGWVANGRDLAPLLEELREIMAILNPGEESDPFEDWLNEDDAPREESAHARAAQASHPEV